MSQTNTIYVSNAGNDTTGNGTLNNPYATLAKVSTVLENSTKILLAKGSTFVNDKLDISSKNNIVIDSYGSGAKPILTGSKVVTGWTDEGGNIWSKTDASFPTEITNVFKGATKLSVVKSANKTSTGGNNTTLVDSALSEADGYYTGAEIAIKYYDWTIGLSRCSAYASKTFTIPAYYQDEVANLIYAVAAGLTYWIQNHKNLLTTQDTWAYDATNKILYIYSVTEPANITVGYGDDCIYGTGAKHISIKNITINNPEQCGINILNSSNITIDAVEFNYAGIYAILFRTCIGIKVINCTATNQNADFVNIQDSTNITITDNTVSYCGYDLTAARYMALFARGQSGSAIICGLSSNITIKNNTISYIGYSGIVIWYCNKFFIENNYVHHYTAKKQDGGGIYITNGTRYYLTTRNLYIHAVGRIIKNIITDGEAGWLSHGIYTDQETQDVEIAYNFVAGARSGIFLHRSITNNVHHNTILCENSQYYGIWFDLQPTNVLRNLIENNLIVCKTTDAASVYIQTTDTRTPNTIKDNEYYYPFGKVGTGTDNTIFKIGVTWYNMEGWTGDESRVVWTRTGEAEITPSLYAGSAKPEEDFLIYLTNPAKTTRTVTAAELPYSDYLDTDGNAMSYPFTIEPYGSKVLVRPN